MLEQKIKTLMGEYAFAVATLQHQLEAAQNEIKELKEKYENQSERT
jgi:hypothetical protein